MNPSAPRARSLRSRLIKPVMVVLALYILGAYLLAPALWRRHERADLAHHDFLTRTTAGIPGDPINVALTGKVPQLLRAMQAAGWSPADPITLRSSVEIGLSVLLDRPYRDAPVSTLLYDGRRQDLAFERLVGALPTGGTMSASGAWRVTATTSSSARRVSIAASASAI